MPFGICDTTLIDLPRGIDAAYMRTIRSADGVTFERFARMVQDRLTAFNRTQDPLVLRLINQPSPEATVETQVPGIFETEEAVEYDVPRGQYGEEPVGYHIPLRGYDVGIQFTERKLKKMSSSWALNQIDSALRGMRARHRRQVLQRFFSPAEIRVDRGTTAVSPGFAGSGTGLNVFTESVKFFPDNNEAVPGGYTHYHRDTSANIAALTLTMRNKMRRWYGNVAFPLLGTQGVVDLITALAAPIFVPAGQAYVRAAADQPVALVDPDLYLGVLHGDILIEKPLADFSSLHFSIYQSFGDRHPENPLFWRYDPDEGRDCYLRSRSMFPFDEAIMLQFLGIGVNRRTAATFGKVAASGSYDAPL